MSPQADGERLRDVLLRFIVDGGEEPALAVFWTMRRLGEAEADDAPAFIDAIRSSEADGLIRVQTMHDRPGHSWSAVVDDDYRELFVRANGPIGDVEDMSGSLGIWCRITDTGKARLREVLGPRAREELWRVMTRHDIRVVEVWAVDEALAEERLAATLARDKLAVDMRRRTMRAETFHLKDGTEVHGVHVVVPLVGRANLH